MIYRFMRKLTVSQRIFGGFLFLMMLFAITVPFILKNQQLLVERVDQVTNVDTKAERLLLQSSKQIESSRVNLMRFLQDYLPNAQESLNDIVHAGRLLAEAEQILTVQEQKATVKQVIETLRNYESIINKINSGDGKGHEISRMVFSALKTGSDIGLQIENIVEKNGARILDENRIVIARLKKSLRMLMVYSAVALIMGLFLATSVGRSITLPISELRESAESFRQGHSDFSLAVTGTDELSILALTFKEMAANLNQNKMILQERADALEEELLQRSQAETELQNYKANLEDLVKNRTSELNKAVDRLNDEISERNKTEEALKKSENRVQAILSAINTGIIIIDPETRIIVDINPIAAQMIGLPQESIIGHMCHNFICPKEMNNCPVLDHDQKINNSERILVTASGEQIPILKTVTSVNLGGKTHLLESFIDISEQKKIENAIRESEEKIIAESARSNILFNASTSAHVIINSSAQIVDCNDTFLSLLGYASLKDVAGKHPAALSPLLQPNGRNSMEMGNEMVGIAIERGRHSFDWLCQNARGESILVEVTIIPVMLNGEPHLMGIWHDLTERKQMEQKIIAEGERLKTILDTAPISIAFSTKGKIHFANPLFIETFGAKPGDASPQLYVNPQERDTLVERLKRDGIVKDFEIQMYNSHKQIRDMLITYLPINYEGEDGILGWLMDITDRKQSEQELKQRLEELERFSRLTINRENRMIQLKEEINTLLAEAGRDKKYRIVES
ncbi:MAG: PAS domain S-box protein [Chloroflexota bacterium]